MSSKLSKFHRALASAGVKVAVATGEADNALAHELAQSLRWQLRDGKDGDALVAHLKKLSQKPDFSAEKYAKFLSDSWVKKAALAYYNGKEADVARFVDKSTSLEAGRIFVDYTLNGEFDGNEATASVATANPLAELSIALAFDGVAHVFVEPGESAVASGEKRIRISYEVWDESAVDAGDTDERGWENEEGVDFTTDEDPIEEAANYLKSEGATEFSASYFEPRGWYEATEEDMHSGDKTNRHFHLTDGWTDEEKEAIYNRVTGKTATAATEVVAFGLESLPDAALNKIAEGKPFKLKAAVSGTPSFPGYGWAKEEAQTVIDKLKGTADYWILSYQTPIFARVGSTWYIIPGKYSPTTGRHQSGLRSQLHAQHLEGHEPTPPAVRKGRAAPKAPDTLPGGLDLT